MDTLSQSGLPPLSILAETGRLFFNNGAFCAGGYGRQRQAPNFITIAGLQFTCHLRDKAQISGILVARSKFQPSLGLLYLLIFWSSLWCWHWWWTFLSWKIWAKPQKVLFSIYLLSKPNFYQPLDCLFVYIVVKMSLFKSLWNLPWSAAIVDVKVNY